MHREFLPPLSPLLILLLLKLLFSRLVETRSDGDKQRALWGSVNVLGQPHAAASRASVSQCTRGKRTRTGDQHVIFAPGSAAWIPFDFVFWLIVEHALHRIVLRRVRVRRFVSFRQWECRGLNLQKLHFRSEYRLLNYLKCFICLLLKTSSILQMLHINSDKNVFRFLCKDVNFIKVLQIFVKAQIL